MSGSSKNSPSRDWASTITLAGLVIATLTLALFDPSCRPRDNLTRGPALRSK